MKIFIAGDLVVNQLYNVDNCIDDNVLELFRNTDHNIVNLEAPITKNNSKILKTGPHLKSREESVIPVLQNLKIDVVTLANNHILDYGIQGLYDTFNSLSKNNISYVGAGENLQNAAKVLTIEQNGLKVAVLNFCENEWSIAKEDKPGANPMSIIDNANQIIDAKKTHDKVICIIHGGHEYYNLPSPRMQKQYRFYAEQGADTVVGHHTHCFSGNEVYRGIPIYYSLGNFLFMKRNTNDEWYTGLVLEMDFSTNEIKHRLHPVKQQKENFNLSLLTGNEKNQVLEKIADFNKIIQDERLLNDNWKKYVEKQSNRYLNYWSPLSFVKNRYLRVVLRRLVGNALNKKGLSLYLNLMRCEAHRDMSKEILGKSIK